MSRVGMELDSGFPPSGKKAGFTILELLVAFVILMSVVVILLSLTHTVSNAWTSTRGKSENFRNARVAFESLNRTLRQATLNSYYDYVDQSGNFRGSGMLGGDISTSFVPYSYASQSELHFICGQGSSLLSGITSQTPVTHAIFFQAPLGQGTNSANAGLEKLLNSCGFYVAYGPDPSTPSFISGTRARNRYRLMQFTPPTESLSVYKTSVAGGNPNVWFTSAITPQPAQNANFVLAENIVALVIWPKLSSGDQAASNSLTSDYSYDSRMAGTFNAATSSFLPTFNQLPPVVEVTMVAIDETSALRMGNTTSPPNDKIGLNSGLFITTTYPLAGQQNQLQIDLQKMEKALSDARVNYRVFQAEIPLLSSKLKK